MARIRSIHPGLFTDEAFVELSPMARVLLLGIWTEADDHGVFDWKPFKLKMRILPCDNADVETLLREIEALQVIQKVTWEGKDYGLVRNFCRFQRPKNPSYRVPVSWEYWNYIGLNADGSVPNHHSSPLTTTVVPQPSPSPTPGLPQPSPSPGETHPQRKEEGGREEESKTPLPSVAGAAREDSDGSVPDDKPKPKIKPRVVVNNEPDKPDKPDKAPDKPDRRKTPIPPGWKPNEAGRALCRAEGHDPDEMEAHFHDICGSNGYLYIDHNAAYRNFVRNQKNFKRGPNGVRQNSSPLRGSILHAADIAIAKLERDIAEENQMREAIVPKLSEH